MAFWSFKRTEVQESYSYSTELIEADSMEEAIEKFWDTDLEFEHDSDYDNISYSVKNVGEDGDDYVDVEF